VIKREKYRPLTLRTLENFQVQHLARKFDFSKESRIAKLVVDYINQKMLEEEKKVGIERVYPFELYVKYQHQHIRIPLFDLSYLEPIYEGGSFADSKELVIKKGLEKLQTINPKAKKKDLLKIINPWALQRFKGPTRYIDELQVKPAPFEYENNSFWQNEINKVKPLLPAQRFETPDLSAPQKTLKNMVETVSKETGLGKMVAQQLVEEIIFLRNLCCPRIQSLKSGEMPLLLTHVKALPSEEMATQFRRHAPAIITVWAPGEIKKRFRTVASCLELLTKRIIRVCFEAYRQNALLGGQELQWIFQISSSRISEIIRSFQRKNHIIVPTPGTILDAGQSMTHKDIIVRLHLEGYSVSEIGRITHHSQRSADNYIGTFEAVMILKLFNVPPHLMARTLQKGQRLLSEYLNLIDKFYEDERTIRNHLIAKGVKFHTPI